MTSNTQSLCWCIHYCIYYSAALSEDTVVIFTYQIGNDIKYTEEKELLLPLPNVTIPANSTEAVSFNVTANKAGNVLLGIDANSSELTE